MVLVSNSFYKQICYGITIENNYTAVQSKQVGLKHKMFVIEQFIVDNGHATHYYFVQEIQFLLLLVVGSVKFFLLNDPFCHKVSYRGL